MSGEVAVFIDLENLRYGLLNAYGVEPDFTAIVEKARKYGRPSVIRAYADFTEHPSEITRQLQVAGIEAINVPVKRSSGERKGQPIDRIKNAADMVLALDAMTEALDADTAGKVKVFLLVTGDADYIKLVTLLRNRFDQRVMVVGVPGSIANDLVRAAGEGDPLDVPAVERRTRTRSRRPSLPWSHGDRRRSTTGVCVSSISGPRTPGRAYRARPTRDGTLSAISDRRKY